MSKSKGPLAASDIGDEANGSDAARHHKAAWRASATDGEVGWSRWEREEPLPWCDDCSKFWNPPELSAGSCCPACGTDLALPIAASPAPSPNGPGHPGRPTATSPSARGASKARASAAASGPAHQGAGEAGTTLQGRPARAKGAPWHFKLLVVGVTVYMVYRIYWLVEWLPKHL